LESALRPALRSREHHMLCIGPHCRPAGACLAAARMETGVREPR